MRVLRLALGLLVIWQAVQFGEWAAGLLGGLFVIIAFTNTGCCGANGCANNNVFKEPANGLPTNDAEFEKVKRL